MVQVLYLMVTLAGFSVQSLSCAFAPSHFRPFPPVSSPRLPLSTFMQQFTRRMNPVSIKNSLGTSEIDVHQQVYLFESILRDGEQGARRTLTPEQKGQFALKLEENMGVDVIDAGLPGASPLDYSGVQNVVSNTEHTIISALAYGTPSEIAVASRALRGAEERSRISTFHRPMELSSRYHSSNNHKSKSSSYNTQRQLLKQAHRAVTVASDLAPQVQYYLIYAGNRNPDFLTELALVASDAGATHIVIADSQSALTPSKAYKLTWGIKEALFERTSLAIHCHNQMGLALPNTLAAISAGATQVESCLLGVGDAGGNLATEQFLAYCEHSVASKTSSLANPEWKDDLFPSSCSTLGSCSLRDAISLAKDVAQMMNFCIGENQPVIGERAFTCTTGIHQDNFYHLSHTTFQPHMAGREWTFALNRHSSRKSVRSFLSKHPELAATITTSKSEALVDAIYSYLSYQVDVMDSKAILSFCDQILKAYTVLHNQGVLICPTTVGYTLITSRNATKMKSLKGRPDDKPCGILGTSDIYKATFGTGPPLRSNQFVNYIVGYLGKPRSALHIPKDAVGPKSEVGIWLECGPVIDYLATRLWMECGDVIVATSCNVAGEGNPQSDHYNLLHVDSKVRSKVDFEVNIPHWERPQLDRNGCWLSAPIWDIENKTFVRKGRNQDIVSSLLKQEQEEVVISNPENVSILTLKPPRTLM